MMFTLNGEILLDDSGSELAFKDFAVGDGKCVQGGSTERCDAPGPSSQGEELSGGSRSAGGRVAATRLT